MKNRITLFTVFFIIVALVILGDVYVGSQTFEYDNQKLISQFFDNRYSKEDIKKLENRIYFSNVYVDYPFWKFNLKYKPECIRKTPFGYYAILIQEDNSFCFVFWTFEKKIHSIYRTKGFVPSDEFKNLIVIGESTFNEVKESNFDFFCYPYSKKVATAHICTDGILMVEYDDNYVAKSIEFFSNKELTKTNDDFLRVVPYILPKDKQTNQHDYQARDNS